MKPKVFVALFFATLMVAFAACSKEEKNPEKDIIGSWKATSITHTETYVDQTHTTSEIIEGDNRITFGGDKILTATTDGDTVGIGSWRFEDGHLLVTPCGILMHLGQKPIMPDVDGSDMTLTTNETVNHVEKTVIMKLKKV